MNINININIDMHIAASALLCINMCMYIYSMYSEVKIAFIIARKEIM